MDEKRLRELAKDLVELALKEAEYSGDVVHFLEDRGYTEAERNEVGLP